MSLQKFIIKPELTYNLGFNKSKEKFVKNVKKKDWVSVGYHEYDKEDIRLEQFDGFCFRLKSSGVNTKLSISSKFRKTDLFFNFFIYHPYLFDVMSHKEKTDSKKIISHVHPNFTNWKKVQTNYWKHRRLDSDYWFPYASFDWYEADNKVYQPFQDIPIEFLKIKENNLTKMFYFKNKKWLNYKKKS